MYRQYRTINNGEQFFVGADTASGLGDKCAIQFISQTFLDVPLVYHNSEIGTVMTNDLFPVLERIYDVTGLRPVVAYERNNGGVFEMERLAALNRKGKYDIFKMPTFGKGIENEEATKLGWDTNTATRPKMLSDLKEAIDKRLITIYDRITIEEMYSFIKVVSSASVKAQAERGAHDDLVMALGVAWQIKLFTNIVSSSPASGPFEEYKHKAQWKRPTDPTLNI